MIRNLFKILVVGTAAIFAQPSFANEQTALENMVSNHKLNICWISYAPGGVRDAASGKLVGYYFDIMNDILAEVHVEPKYIEVEWGTFVAALQSQKCDVSIAGTLMSISRASVLAFSRPLFYLSSRLAVKKSETRINGIADVANMPGIKIAVQQGSSSSDFAQRQFPKASISALASRDPSAPLLELASGRAEAVVLDAWLAEKFEAAHPDIVKVVGPTFNMEGVGWVFRQRDSELREFFDVALEKLRLNGIIERDVKKYPESGRFIVDERIKAIR